MTDQFDQIHQLTNDHLAKRLQEYARRHVGEEKEIYLEAARRLTPKRLCNFTKTSKPTADAVKSSTRKSPGGLQRNTNQKYL